MQERYLFGSTAFHRSPGEKWLMAATQAASFPVVVVLESVLPFCGMCVVTWRSRDTYFESEPMLKSMKRAVDRIISYYLLRSSIPEMIDVP